MAQLIFLSHIHEETQLAQTIQKAIEDEFSGFVDVFVSSDGRTIPAGSNFLKKIEDGLVNCIGAIYLISPVSVKRNWINFELGAVWIRNSISIKSGGKEIPTIPFCHSGITPSTMPTPLNNLNSVNANKASELENAFRSIQNAVGGKGSLKTNFDRLATQVIDFESAYTFGDKLVELLRMIKPDNAGIVNLLKLSRERGTDGTVSLNFKFQSNEFISKLKDLEKGGLKEHIDINLKKAGTAWFDSGVAITGADVMVHIKGNTLIMFEDLLLKAFP